MIDELLAILEATKYPVYRQGSMSNDATYPDTFITFWNSQSPTHAFYDNTVDYGSVWVYDINVYSSDPEKTYSVLDEIISELKAAEWIVGGNGYDVQSDEETHTGRGVEVAFLKIN